MSHLSTTEVGGLYPRAHRAAVAMIAATMVSLGWAADANADHGLPLGANYGVTDAHAPGVDAPAFPGPKAFWFGTCDLQDPSTSENGVGIAPAVARTCIDIGESYAPANAFDPDPPRETTWGPGGEPSWRLDNVSQAGSHPDISVSFWMQRSPHSPLNSGSNHTIGSDGDTKNAIVRLPAGFLGNPNAVPPCPAELLRGSPPLCGPESQIGIATVTLGGGGVTSGGATEPGLVERMPIWSVEPRDGKLAEFMMVVNYSGEGRVNIPVVARARTEGDYGVDTLALKLQAGLPLLSATITLWGVPYAAHHDEFRPEANYVGSGRPGIPATGLPDLAGHQPQVYRPEWGPVKPFVVTQTECAPEVDKPVTNLLLESWHDVGNIKSYLSPVDAPLTGCEKLGFDPDLDVAATSSVADSPSGLNADLTVPQNLDAPFDPPAVGAPQGEVDQYAADATDHWRSDDGLATSHLKDAVVSLPEGLTLNPAAATGLAGCSDSEIGLTQFGSPSTFDNHDPFRAAPRCPEGSKVGSVEVYSPVLPPSDDDVPGETNLTGDVVLGNPRPGDVRASDEPLTTRLFLVLRSKARGLVAKVAGRAVIDPVTGQLTTTFEQNPRVPFESLRLRLKGGSRGTLATAPQCGPKAWSGLLTPWTAAHGAGGSAASVGGAFGPVSGCAHDFSPAFTAGMDSRSAGGSGVFTFTFDRPDRDQWLRGLTAELPQGLLANVGSVPLCTNAQAGAAACAEASKIGVVDAAAGAGTPFTLERKGSVYLTEGYKGAPFGLATVVPVEAGPFRGENALEPVVVRQALHVDRTRATGKVVSDPFPQIHHGIPLRLRKAVLLMNRPGFMRNPTGCDQKQIAATFTSVEGTQARRTQPFSVSGCRKLRFKPALKLRLSGRKQTKTNGHPGIHATVTQRKGEAAIRRAEVRLPKALVLDIDNANALCEFIDGTKDDLENHCPKGSIVGRATAVSPLLSKPLRGNVYFVKNIRIDPVTKREIRTLPMIVIALRGEIAVNLRGKSSVRAGRLVNSFKAVPDAPVSSFKLDIAGGKSGILKVTANRKGNIDICRRDQTAEAFMTSHSGKYHDRSITVKTPCKKRKKRR